MNLLFFPHKAKTDIGNLLFFLQVYFADVRETPQIMIFLYFTGQYPSENLIKSKILE